MNPFAATVSVLGLGLAGFDPFGALIVLPALAMGAKRRVVVLFFVVSGLATVLAGVLLGQSVELIFAWLAENLAIPAPARAALQVLAAGALGYWAVRRWNARHEPPKERRKKPFLAGAAGMSLAGLGWGVGALTDPTFFGVAGVTTTFQSTLEVTLAFTAWFLVSQAPLVLVVLALAAGRDSWIMRRVGALAEKLARPTSYLLTFTLAILALALAANAVSYLASGAFWPV